MEQLIAALLEARWPEEQDIYIAGIARLLNEQPPQPDCAWCMVEAGVPRGNGSHGICARHKARTILQAKLRKMARRVA